MLNLQFKIYVISIYVSAYKQLENITGKTR